jgi:uncharacterized protein with GYD domain
MPHFMVQWKFNPQSFETMRRNPLDRYATSVRLAEAFKGSIISMHNRMGEYDGLAIFSFPDAIHATAHSVHAMATGAFLKHECELLLSPSEYKLALLMSHDTATDYLPPNKQDGM